VLIEVNCKLNGDNRKFLTTEKTKLSVSAVYENGSQVYVSQPEFVSYDPSTGKTTFQVTVDARDKFYVKAKADKFDVSSGWAHLSVEMKEAEAEKPAFDIRRYTVGGEVKPHYLGKSHPLPFEAYSKTINEKAGTTTIQPISSLLCFGLRTTKKKLNLAPEYLIYPAEVKIKKEVPTYKLGKDYVVVDRDLYYRGASYKTTNKYELYKTQEELVKLAEKGVVAILIKPATGNAVWVKLDGSLIEDSVLDALCASGQRIGEDDVLYGSANTFAKRTVASYLRNPNSTLFADADEKGEAPNLVASDRYKKYHMPNALVVESKSDVWLARQNIFAKVKVDPSDASKATVTRIDGKELGAIDISIDGRKPKDRQLVKSWEQKNKQKITSEIGKLDGGGFIFNPRQEMTGFDYMTYYPNITNTLNVVGFIYAMKDFYDMHNLPADNE
jgi:hypothetical protein